MRILAKMCKFVVCKLQILFITAKIGFTKYVTHKFMWAIYRVNLTRFFLQDILIIILVIC